MADTDKEGVFKIEAAGTLQRWPEISNLFGRHTRLALSRGTQFEQWELFAFACLARSHYAVGSIRLLSGRGPDCAVLARTLYEHVVALAWLLIDPANNYLALLKREHDERTKLFNELSKFAPVPTTKDQLDLALLSSGMNPNVKAAPSTYDLARKADEHWQAKLPLLPFGFARAYGGTFRNYSAYAHPSVVGIYPFSTTDGRPTSESLDSLAIVEMDAHMTFASALFVSTSFLRSMKPEDVLVAYGLTDAEEHANG